MREAIAWGLERGVDIDGVHITDAAFAGSDTLATASARAVPRARHVRGGAPLAEQVRDALRVA